MSKAQNFQSAEQPLSIDFTVKMLHGCRIVFGEIPVSALGMLTHGFSAKALMAIDIADRIGATLVIGEPEDLDKLREADLPLSAKRQADAVAAEKANLLLVASWLREGNRGASSNAMCKRIFGIPESARDDHPHDPSDLLRCLQFLDATHSHDQLPLMADVSSAWALLVPNWAFLADTLRTEAKYGTSAPKTLAEMRAILSK